GPDGDLVGSAAGHGQRNSAEQADQSESGGHRNLRDAAAVEPPCGDGRAPPALLSDSPPAAKAVGCRASFVTPAPRDGGGTQKRAREDSNLRPAVSALSGALAPGRTISSPFPLDAPPGRWGYPVVSGAGRCPSAGRCRCRRVAGLSAGRLTRWSLHLPPAAAGCGSVPRGRA